MTVDKHGARVLAAFDGLSEETRAELAEALCASDSPILVAIGEALTIPPVIGEYRIGKAIHDGYWFDGGSTKALAEALSADELWGTIRRVLRDYLAHPPHLDIVIASDEPR